MGAEIVLNECDLPGLRKMRVGQFLEDLREIDGGVTVGYLDMPPAFQRREHHEQICRAIALILQSVRFALASPRSARAFRRSVVLTSRPRRPRGTPDRGADDKRPTHLPCWPRRRRWRSVE